MRREPVASRGLHAGTPLRADWTLNEAI